MKQTFGEWRKIRGAERKRARPRARIEQAAADLARVMPVTHPITSWVAPLMIFVKGRSMAFMDASRRTDPVGFAVTGRFAVPGFLVFYPTHRIPTPSSDARKPKTKADTAKRHGLRNDSRIKALAQAAMQAIPTTRGKDGNFVRPEMTTLDALRLLVWDDLPAPPEEEVPLIDNQLPLFAKPSDELGDDEAAEDLDEEAEDDDESDDE